MRVRVSRWLWALGAGTVLMFGITAVRKGITMAELAEGLVPWTAVAAAAVLHELGHIAAAWGLGVRVRRLRVDLFGARMELEGLLSYGQEFFTAAGGPLVNFLCAALVHPRVSRGDWPWGSLFLGASLVLGGVNLLPVGTLDGGRMLRSGAAFLWGDRVSTALWRGITMVFLGLLWLLTVYALLRAGQMVSWFVFCLCLLLRSIAGEDGGS